MKASIWITVIKESIVRKLKSVATEGTKGEKVFGNCTTSHYSQIASGTEDYSLLIWHDEMHTGLEDLRKESSLSKENFVLLPVLSLTNVDPSVILEVEDYDLKVSINELHISCGGPIASRAC